MQIPQTKTELINVYLNSEQLEALPNGEMITNLKNKLSFAEFLVAVQYISNHLIQDISQYFAQIFDIKSLEKLNKVIETEDRNELEALIFTLYTQDETFKNLFAKSILLSTKLILNE